LFLKLTGHCVAASVNFHHGYIHGLGQ
jgi:hypothetical protein